jgi:chaperonin cofactor prefoldin
MREKWTDERLDDLNAKVDRGFDRVEAEMRTLRGEMNGLRTEMNDLRAEMNARFDALNRTMLGFGGALLVAIVASNLAS